MRRRSSLRRVAVGRARALLIGVCASSQARRFRKETGVPSPGRWKNPPSLNNSQSLWGVNYHLNQVYFWKPQILFEAKNSANATCFVEAEDDTILKVIFGDDKEGV